MGGPGSNSHIILLYYFEGFTRLECLVYLIIPLVTPPRETLNKIQADMYKFWGGKPDKIKREVTNNSKEHGGLDMIDFKEFFTSLKCKLVGILISDNYYNPTWKQIVLNQLNNDRIKVCLENNQVKRGCKLTEDLLTHYEKF